MKAAILTVGTEILFGQIENTNASYLSRELNNLGIDVMYHNTVGDNLNRLADNLLHLLKECDLIITTGGLGPTRDDITKEGVSIAIDKPMMLNDDVKIWLENRFKKTGRNITENNYRQCYFPEGADIMLNDNGTAPGMINTINYNDESRYLITLPGPPREMKPMFQMDVIPFIKSLSDEHIVYEFVRTSGIGESLLESKIMDLVDEQTDPTIATYVTYGEVYLRITSKRRTAKEAHDSVTKMIEMLKSRIGQYIYYVGNKNIEEIVIEKLKEKNLTVSSSESCTGGMFGETITKYPGSSEIFQTSLVTYSNESKANILGVSKKTLDSYGAVSEETAGEMAIGTNTVSKSPICVSVTGIAGPGGGSSDKPVGTVCFGIYHRGRLNTYKKLFKGDRNSIRKQSVLWMFRYIYEVLGEKDEK